MSYVYPFIYNKKITNTNVKKLSLLIKNNAENKIKRIIISNDSKLHYFKNLSDFQKENFQNYTQYNVSDKVKFRNFSRYSYNYAGNINAVCSVVSSFFSKHNQLHTFIPYILAFITLLYFICNKNKIFIPSFFVTAFVFVFFFLMCYNGLFDYFPYGDEIPTLSFVSNVEPFASLFKDPGNPPFFYIILKIFNILFGFSVIKIRCFILFLSLLFIFALWLFVKNKFDKNIANLAVFIACLNAPLIMYCQIIRSYGLQILLTPVIIWALFNIIEKNRIKDYIIYGILVILAVNTHYYEILFVFGNLLFVLFYFLLKKRKSDILKFLVVNFIGGLSFLPFFFFTALKGAVLDPSFNYWLYCLFSIKFVEDSVLWFFGSGITFLIFCFMFIGLLLYKKKELPLLTVYCFYIVSFVILSAILFSLIRPIFLNMYLVFLVPAIIIYFISFINLIKNNKFILIVYSLVICLIISFYTDRFNSFKTAFFPKNSSQDEIVFDFLTNYIKNENLYENTYFLIKDFFGKPNFKNNFESSKISNTQDVDNNKVIIFSINSLSYRYNEIKTVIYPNIFSHNKILFNYLLDYRKNENLYNNKYIEYTIIPNLQYVYNFDYSVAQILKHNNKAVIFSIHPLYHKNDDVKMVIYPIMPKIRFINYEEMENLYKYTLKNKFSK